MAADADIFISFPGKDRKVATTLCSALESRGFTCWISARDILPGENFQVAIVRAIRKAKVMLLVFTANSNQSEEMSKELALASQQKLAVIPLRVEDVTPNDAFAYEFATRQWIDFFADWEYAIDQLAAQIAKITAPDPALMAASGRPAAKAATTDAKKPGKPPISIEPLPGVTPAPGPELAPVLDSQGESFAGEADADPTPRKGMNPALLIGGAVAVIAAVTVAVFAFSGNKGKSSPPPREPAQAAAPAPASPTPAAATPTPPTPPQPGDAQAAATAPPAADATAAGAAPATPGAAPATPVKVKKAAAPKKTHAPLRASRSDLPY